ncbi:Putative metal chaperone, involved in Zn homeostasis, GTPase of COG0523 family [Klebsiella pneumoniae IS53]|nr:Putative metal chaperone, involved in Zn homeostasis, GTPase of COG0523 family [Klebsiella pneumoniae IS53]
MFNTSGFMLEEKVVSATPRFHFVAEKQNDVSSIVVELDYPVDISEVSRVMENLLLSFAEQLMRYKGMLWIDGEPNRLLFQGVQRLYSADWDRPWGDENAAQHAGVYRHSVAGRGNSRGVLPGYDANLPACALRRRPPSL